MLEQIKHHRVRIIDIDGTVVKKLPWSEWEEHFPESEVFPQALKQVNEWFDQGDYIIFWTARPKAYRQLTMDMLDRYGFRYHELRCGKPYCHEVHIYDDNMMHFHKVEREQGLQYEKDLVTAYKVDDKWIETGEWKRLLETLNTTTQPTVKAWTTSNYTVVVEVTLGDKKLYITDFISNLPVVAEGQAYLQKPVSLSMVSFKKPKNIVSEIDATIMFDATTDIRTIKIKIRNFVEDSLADCDKKIACKHGVIFKLTYEMLAHLINNHT